MKRTIITIGENGIVSILNGDVWMSEPELVGLFGVIAPTLRAAIRAIYKSGTLNPAATQRCEVITPASWAAYYNIEVIIALAFRLNTYEAARIRQKVLESVARQKENGVNMFVLFGGSKSRSDFLS